MTNTAKLHVPDQWHEIAQYVDRYEDRVKPDELPEVEEVLEGAAPGNRLAVLAEVVQVDMEHQWKRGRRVTAVDYLERFPELRNHATVAEELSHSELQLRHRYGESPGVRRPSAIGLRTVLSPAGPHEAASAPTAGLTSATMPSGAAEEVPHNLGKYVVEAQIGAGGYGTVYLAYDPDLERKVAIKVASGIPKSSLDNREVALHEAKCVARVRHPHVVAVLDAGQLEDGRPYIVCEYIHGCTLRDWIAKGDYALTDAVEWVAALADALRVIHHSGIVHRDIKPGNILIDEDGQPRLTDFGLATRDDRFVIDDRDAIVGTYRYMSPEQAGRRSGWASPASDIYSLGVVLYELLTGRCPFQSNEVDRLLEEVRERVPVAPRVINSAIPPAIEKICLQALAKDPQQRPKTAGDMARSLRAAMKPPRHWMPLAGMVASLAVIVILTCLFWPHPQPLRPLAVCEPDIRILASRDAAPRSLSEDLPHAGERFQIHGALSREANLYMILFRDAGKSELLWPTEYKSEKPRRTSEVYYPEDEKRWAIVPDGEGVMIVLVAAAEKPLAAEELDELLNKKIDLPPPHRSAGPQYSPRRLATPTPESRLSRGGERLSTTQQSSYSIPRTFEEAIKQKFDAYSMVMFSHFEPQSKSERANE